MENRLGDLTLVFHRKTDDFGLLNRSARGLARGRHYEVRQAAPFDLRGALEQRMDVGRQPGFETGAGGNFLHTPSIRQFAVYVQRFALPACPPSPERPARSSALRDRDLPPAMKRTH